MSTNAHVENRSSVHSWNFDSPSECKVGSLIALIVNTNIKTGTIKWIGHLKDEFIREEIAGILMDEENEDFGAGDLNNVILFDCPPRRGVFTYLSNCRNYADISQISENLKEQTEECIVQCFQRRTKVQIHLCNQIEMGFIERIIYERGNLYKKVKVEVQLEQAVYNRIKNVNTDNQRFFIIQKNKSVIVPIGHCFMDEYVPVEDNSSFTVPMSKRVEVKTPCIRNPSDARLNEGMLKGIQGQNNSCYMDTILFALFTFSSKFDHLLTSSISEGRSLSELKEYLREYIVYPLRHDFFVHADRILKLRHMLTNFDNTPKGILNEEQDCEEFINFFLGNVLKCPPLIKFSGKNSCLCYQIFADRNENLQYPTTEYLLQHSFLDMKLLLSEIPDCLILFIPRHGSQVKMYDRVFPSKQLDLYNFTDQGFDCSVCGEAVAEIKCKTCFLTNKDIEIQRLYLCKVCSNAIHQDKKSRHEYQEIPKKFISRHSDTNRSAQNYIMHLRSIICIQTSHYVLYTKCGDDEKFKWFFFDSMAHRKGNLYNVPEVTTCEDFDKWLSREQYEKIRRNDASVPNFINRVCNDVYMCIYEKEKDRPDSLVTAV